METRGYDLFIENLWTFFTWGFLSDFSDTHSQMETVDFGPLGKWFHGKPKGMVKFLAWEVASRPGSVLHTQIQGKPKPAMDQRLRLVATLAQT